MKTLDEVIFEAPYTPTPWEVDALFYLKEYQTLQYGYIKAMADLDDNPPLTWDELKIMEGKPVWVEGTNYTRWAIITGIYDGEIIRFEGHKLYASESKDDIGLSWQAYRKERK